MRGGFSGRRTNYDSFAVIDARMIRSHLRWANRTETHFDLCCAAGRRREDHPYGICENALFAGIKPVEGVGKLSGGLFVRPRSRARHARPIFWPGRGSYHGLSSYFFRRWRVSAHRQKRSKLARVQDVGLAYPQAGLPSAPNSPAMECGSCTLFHCSAALSAAGETAAAVFPCDRGAS